MKKPKKQQPKRLVYIHRLKAEVLRSVGINKMADKNKTFLEGHQERMEILGFWVDTYKSTVIMQMENMYKTEIIKEWGISDIVINGDKVLLKWFKRHHPLDAEELKKRYGK